MPHSSSPCLWFGQFVSLSRSLQVRARLVASKEELIKAAEAELGEAAVI